MNTPAVYVCCGNCRYKKKVDNKLICYNFPGGLVEVEKDRFCCKWSPTENDIELAIQYYLDNIPKDRLSKVKYGKPLKLESKFLGEGNFNE